MILVIDIGSSSARALLFDDNCQVVAQSARPYAFMTEPRGAAVIDADFVRETAETCLDEVLTHPRAEEITAVGMATFVGNVLGVRSGKAITPVYTYADTRSGEQVRQLAALVDAAQVHQHTGCRLHTAYHPARLLWLRQTEPETFARVEQWMDIAAYCYLHWFGEVATSYSTASWSGLLNRATLAWDAELLDLLEMRAEQFTPLTDYDASLSGLRAAYAGRWRALAKVPFYISIGDGAAANFGAGCLSPDRVALTLGTTAALRTVVHGGLPHVPAGLWSYRITRELYLIGGATSEGGNVFAWLRRTLVLDWSALDEALMKCEPGAHGLTFLPLLAGERSPGWRENATGVIEGIRLATTPVDIAQAALEGMALRLSLILEQLRPLLHESVTIIGGGGALRASAAWTQMIADALGHPIFVPDGDEITALGVARLVRRASGSDLTTTEPDGRVFTPRPQYVKRMRELREQQSTFYRRVFSDDLP